MKTVLETWEYLLCNKYRINNLCIKSSYTVVSLLHFLNSVDLDFRCLWIIGELRKKKKKKKKEKQNSRPRFRRLFCASWTSPGMSRVNGFRFGRGRGCGRSSRPTLSVVVLSVVIAKWSFGGARPFTKSGWDGPKPPSSSRERPCCKTISRCLNVYIYI